MQRLLEKIVKKCSCFTYPTATNLWKLYDWLYVTNIYETIFGNFGVKPQKPIPGSS